MTMPYLRPSTWVIPSPWPCGSRCLPRSNIQTLIANGNSGANSNGFKVLVNTYKTTDQSISFESGDGSVTCHLQN